MFHQCIPSSWLIRKQVKCASILVLENDNVKTTEPKKTPKHLVPKLWTLEKQAEWKDNLGHVIKKHYSVQRFSTNHKYFAMLGDHHDMTHIIICTYLHCLVSLMLRAVQKCFPKVVLISTKRWNLPQRILQFLHFRRASGWVL